MPKPTGRLSPREKRFVDEYLVDLNGTRAAIRAGFAKKGAHSRASELMRKPKVKAAIEKAVEARSKRTEITQDLVLKELYWVLTSNPDNYDAAGRPKEGAPAEVMRAIGGVDRTILSTDDGGNRLVKVKLRLWDKNRALSLAMRHLGMLNDNLTINVDEEFQKRIANAASDFERGITGIVARLRASQNS